MKEEVKEKIIEVMQFLAEQNGKSIYIIDSITTSENNYDRHFTTTSRFIVKQKHFGVRFSGAIAMLEGDHQSFEFRTNSIEKITINGSEIELVVHIKDSIFRMIRLIIQ